MCVNATIDDNVSLKSRFSKNTTFVDLLGCAAGLGVYDLLLEFEKRLIFIIVESPVNATDVL